MKAKRVDLRIVYYFRNLKLLWGYYRIPQNFVKDHQRKYIGKTIPFYCIGEVKQMIEHSLDKVQKGKLEKVFYAFLCIPLSFDVFHDLRTQNRNINLQSHNYYTESKENKNLLFIELSHAFEKCDSWRAASFSTLLWKDEWKFFKINRIAILFF